MRGENGGGGGEFSSAPPPPSPCIHPPFIIVTDLLADSSTIDQSLTHKYHRIEIANSGCPTVIKRFI